MPKRKFPFPLGHPCYPGIDDQLDAVLKELTGEKAVGKTATVLWVSCRLNRTGAKVPSPVFVGWVEAPEARNKRILQGHETAPAYTRINDTHVSTLYNDCYKAFNAGLGVVKRDWKKDKADDTSQELGRLYYGETHRRSMAVTISDQFAGTLNAAFAGDPSAKDEAIERVLRKYAQTDSSALVKKIATDLDASRLAKKK